MPYQNRVTPFSTIEINPARGMFMGNRGILHNEHQQLLKQTWQHKAWVTCVLNHTDKKGQQWHRKIMQPRRYTELFFLDEATALAAGHRPCALCRNADYKRFMSAAGDNFTRAVDLDNQLHKERIASIKERKYTNHMLSHIPNGAMFIKDLTSTQPILKWHGAYYPWTHKGYQTSVNLEDKFIWTLTPKSILTTINNGYVPAVDVKIRSC